MGQDVDFMSLGFPNKEMYEFPNITNIEVYRGDCYCSCVHCPVGTTETSRRKERFGNRGMDLALYKKNSENRTCSSTTRESIHSCLFPQ